VDHAWTTKPETSRAQLLDNPQLVERLTSMMDISVDAEEEEVAEEATAGTGADDEVVSKYPDLEVDQSMVELVASQGKVTEQRARVALQNENGDILAALMVKYSPFFVLRVIGWNIGVFERELELTSWLLCSYLVLI
jgi:NACalpha-BTF3-like transcription factor